MTFEMLMEEKFEAGMEKGIKQGIAKGREEGIAEGMEKGIVQGMEKGITQGIEQGAYNKSLETAKKLLEDNIPTETVVKYTGLPLETVMELKDQL